MEDEDQDDSRPRGEISVIAVPLAGKKLTKKLYKVSKKAAASKLLKRGVKEVVKVLRKADKFKGCVGSGAPCMPACLLCVCVCVCARAPADYLESSA